MATNANFAVAIEIHSHHNEFKMLLPVECRVKFKSGCPRGKKKVIETPNNLWRDHVERDPHERFIFNMFVFFLRPVRLEPILYIITNKGNISERTI